MTSQIPRIIILLAVVAFTSVPGRAQMVSGSDYVRIEGRMQSDTDRKEDDKKKVAAVTQNRTLSISLSGKARDPETRTGKWTAYGRSDNQISVIESGDFKLDLSKGAQKVETKKVSATHTPAHTPKGDKNKPAKRVDATGTKFVGFSVTVKDGEKTVGEYYDPAGLKAEAAK